MSHSPPDHRPNRALANRPGGNYHQSGRRDVLHRRCPPGAVACVRKSNDRSSSASADSTLALSSDKFHAAAPIEGSPDRFEFVNGGWKKAVPFDEADFREFQGRSPVAYAKSFKCPVRIYYAQKLGYADSSVRTALLAKQAGLDVEAVGLAGDHFNCVPEAMKGAIEFFHQR